MLITILFVLAFVLTALHAFGVGAPRVHLGWAGVSVALLAAILARWPL